MVPLFLPPDDIIATCARYVVTSKSSATDKLHVVDTRHVAKYIL